MVRFWYWLALALIGCGCLLAPVAQSQPGRANPALVPRPEPVADTKLLMEGLAGANIRGLGNLLRDRPTEAAAWTFARGQALLIAETGNLLLIRPPRTASNQEAWMRHAADLRGEAEKLARLVAARDYTASRAALASVANVCNRCHQAFRVNVRVDPFTSK